MKSGFIKIIPWVPLGLVFALAFGGGVWFFQKDAAPIYETPEIMLLRYMEYAAGGEYEQMYELLCEKSRELSSKDDFIARNQNIYEGIEVQNMDISILSSEDLGDGQTYIQYHTRMDTLAGEISFTNEAVIMAEEGPHLFWTDSVIFPFLQKEDRVRVLTLEANRGEILDRNGLMLAGQGHASSVGLVPGKMNEDPLQRQRDLQTLADLLEVTAQSIEDKINASYVKPDTFVPLKTMPGGQTEKETSLLEVRGVMITNVPVRYYPFRDVTSHITGYVQNVSQEDLESLAGQGYHVDSIVGKIGLEKMYETHLKGQDGYEIRIVDQDGETKKILARKDQVHGSDIRLTLDIRMQILLYEQFKQDNSAAVAMDPLTGEVLALISTPSYDANDFVLGMSQEKWDSLNLNKNKPMFNRFQRTFVPGSSIKPLVGALGLSLGVLGPNENFGFEGKRWQEDAGWGRYYVTTVEDYGKEITLKNALIFSDNIYFAKAALRIGEEAMAERLLALGFDETIPFEYGLYSSYFAVDNQFSSRIQLADTGYGQGSMLVNPVHMASMYSAFVNNGNMVKPRLFYEKDFQVEYWKNGVFTPEAAAIILDDMVAVLAHRDQHLSGESVLAGKSGTAELKSAQDDESGTELGWYNIMTADREDPFPLLVITMVEDVKDRGGSTYVMPKVKAVFDGRMEY